MIAGTLEIQMLANMARLQADMTQAKNMVGGAMKNIESAVASAKSALGALGVGLSIGYFASLIKGSIAAMDHLHDLSKSTSITIENLSGLSLLAKQTGTDLDGLAKGINRMSVEMGKDPEKFRALGVTAKDNTKAFMQLADIFNSLTDVQQRNALAQAIFSKSWAELAPALSEGSRGIGDAITKGKTLSKITEEMTKKADELNDKWAELVGTGGMLNSIVGKMLDPLLSITNQMIAARDGASGFIDMLRRFFSIGGDQSGNPEKALGDVIEKLNKLRKTEEEFAKMGLLKRIFSADDIALVRTQIEALERQKSMLEGLLGAPFPKPEPPSAADSAAAAARAKAFLDTEKNAAAARAEEKLYTTALQALEQELGKLNEQTQVEKTAYQETKGSLQKLTEEHKKHLLVVARDVDLKQQLITIGKAALEYAKAYVAEQERQDAAVANFNQTQSQSLKDIEFETKLLRDEAPLVASGLLMKEDEIKLVSRLSLERETATELRKIDLDLEKALLALGPQTNAGYEEAAKTLRDLAAAQKEALPDVLAARANAKLINDLNKNSIDEFKNMWSIVESTGKDAFVQLMSHGTSAFKSIGQALKTAVIDLLYQLTVRKWIINIGTNVAGSLGVPMAANVAGSSLGLMGNGASMLGTFGSAGAYASGYATTAFASEATSAALIESGTAGVAGAGMEAGALAGMGPVGWAALAALAAYELFGQGEGDAQRTGNWAGRLGGMTGPSNDRWFSADMQPAQTAFAQQLAASEQSIISLLKLSDRQISSINDAMAAHTGPYGFGMEHTPVEQSGAFQAIAADRLQAVAQTLGLTIEQLTQQLADAQKAIDLAPQRRQMEIALMEAQGDAAGALAAKRADELAAMDATLRPLQQQIYAAQDQAKAADALVAAQEAAAQAMAGARDAMRATQDYYVQQAKDAAAAMEDARGAVWAAFDREAQRVSQLQADLQTQRQAIWQAYDTEAGKLKTLGDAMRGFGASLREAALHMQTGAGAPNAFGAAQSQFRDLYRRAKLGDQTALGQLGAAGQTYFGLAESVAVTHEDVLRIFAEVQNALTDSAAVADRNANVADQQLAALQAQVEAVVGTRETAQSIEAMLADFATAKQAADAASAQLEISRVQVEHLVGIRAGVQSLADAIAAFIAAQGASRAANAAVPRMTPGGQQIISNGVSTLALDPATASGGWLHTPSGSWSVQELRQMASGFAGAGGNLVDAYNTWRSAGGSLQQLDAALGWAPDTAESWARANGLPVNELPAYRSGTGFVPETGPALLHRGERVTSAPANDELVAEIRALREEVSALRETSEKTETHTRKTANLTEAVTQGQLTFIVATAAA